MLTLLILIFSSATAFSSDPIWGPEFTFSNEETRSKTISDYLGNRVLRTSGNAPYLDRFKQAIMNKCPDCRLDEVKDTRNNKAYKITIESLDDFFIEIITDVGCVEIKTSPQTLSFFKEHKAILQSYIFQTASELDLSTELAGGGHIHSDVQKLFNGNSQLLLDYITDYLNNIYQVEYIFGNRYANDTRSSYFYNGIPSSEQLKRFENIRAQFKTGRMSFDELARTIVRKVFNFNQNYWNILDVSQGVIHDYRRHRHFQALNLSNYVNPKRINTIEHRMFEAQENMDEFIFHIETISRRVKYLEKYPNVEYNPVSLSNMNQSLAFDLYLPRLKEIGFSFDDVQKFFKNIPSDYIPYQRNSLEKPILSNYSGKLNAYECARLWMAY